MAKSCVTAELACPVERVWETVTDLSRQSWRRDVERVERTGERSFVEYTGDGFATAFTVTRLEPPHHWAFELENETVKGRWTGAFLPVPDGCSVTFTEDVTPKKAWMCPFAEMYLKRQQRRYLEDLRKALGPF